MNELTESIKELFHQFFLKLTGSILFMALVQHALMFLCFSALVAFDLISRWLAISSGMIRKEGNPKPSLLSMILALPRARRQGLIRSGVMKEEGLSKLILYSLSVLIAGCADFLLLSSGQSGGMTALVVSYLTSTEALSIVENLSEAGLPSMISLLQKMKGYKK